MWTCYFCLNSNLKSKTQCEKCGECEKIPFNHGLSSSFKRRITGTQATAPVSEIPLATDTLQSTLPSFCPICRQHENGFPQPAHIAKCPFWAAQQKIQAATEISRVMTGPSKDFSVVRKPPLTFCKPTSASLTGAVTAASSTQRYSMGADNIFPPHPGQNKKDTYSWRCICGWLGVHVTLEVITHHQKCCLRYRQQQQAYYHI